MMLFVLKLLHTKETFSMTVCDGCFIWLPSRSVALTRISTLVTFRTEFPCEYVKSRSLFPESLLMEVLLVRRT